MNVKSQKHCQRKRFTSIWTEWWSSREQWMVKGRGSDSQRTSYFIRLKMKRSKSGCFCWSISMVRGGNTLPCNEGLSFQSLTSSNWSELPHTILKYCNLMQMLWLRLKFWDHWNRLKPAKQVLRLTLSGTISMVMYSRCGIIGNNFIICYVSHFSISGCFNRSSQCGNLSVTWGNFRLRAGGHRKAPFSRRTFRSHPRQAASNPNKLSTHVLYNTLPSNHTILYELDASIRNLGCISTRC